MSTVRAEGFLQQPADKMTWREEMCTKASPLLHQGNPGVGTFSHTKGTQLSCCRTFMPSEGPRKEPALMMGNAP